MQFKKETPHNNKEFIINEGAEKDLLGFLEYKPSPSIY